MLQVDRHGELLWEKTYEEPNQCSNAVSVHTTSSGGIAILANSRHYYKDGTFSGMLATSSLIFTDAEGNVESMERLRKKQNIRADSMNPAGENSFIITGMFDNPEDSNLGSRCIWLMKTP